MYGSHTIANALQACFTGTLFLFVPFPFTYFPLACNAVEVGICCHTAKVFTGSSWAVKFKPQAVLTKILPLSLRASVICRKKLDSPKPYTQIAYETKMTDPTDDAYKKSQHDEER